MTAQYRLEGPTLRGHGFAATEGASRHHDNSNSLAHSAARPFISDDEWDLACALFVAAFISFPCIFVASVYLLLIG